MDDQRLLRDYFETRSDKSFAALIDRHIGLVYGTCLRELRDPALAEDATQIVFLILARKAKSLRSAGALASWLFTTARFTSRSLRTQELRRKEREERAMEESRAGAPADDWDEIVPALDDALAALKDSDRQILLLRYFDGASFKEAGDALGLSENTARMRAARATERLRRQLVKSGASLSAVGLAAALGEHAAEALPNASTLDFAQSALQAGSIGSSSRLHILAQGVKHAMFVSKVQIAALIGTLVFASAAIYTAHNRSAALYAPAAISTHTSANPSMIKLISDSASGPDLAGSQILRRCRNAYATVQSFQQDAEGRSAISARQHTSSISGPDTCE